MFAAWGAFVYRARWAVLATVLAVTVLGGLWGTGLFGHLTQGGYTDPASESTQAADLITRAFGPQGGDVIVLYTAPPGRSVDAYAEAAHAVLHDLPPSAVRRVTSYWDVHAPQLVTPDHRHALASITLNAGTADQQRIAYQRIEHYLPIAGLTSGIGGPVPTQAAMIERSGADLTRAEAISPLPAPYRALHTSCRGQLVATSP